MSQTHIDSPVNSDNRLYIVEEEAGGTEIAVNSYDYETNDGKMVTLVDENGHSVGSVSSSQISLSPEVAIWRYMESCCRGLEEYPVTYREKIIKALALLDDLRSESSPLPSGHSEPQAQESQVSNDLVNVYFVTVTPHRYADQTELEIITRKAAKGIVNSDCHMLTRPHGGYDYETPTSGLDFTAIDAVKRFIINQARSAHKYLKESAYDQSNYCKMMVAKGAALLVSLESENS